MIIEDIDNLIEDIEREEFSKEKIITELKTISKKNQRNHYRLMEIQEVLTSIIQRDFTKKAKLLGNRDDIDAVILTVNFVSELMEESLLTIEDKNKKLEHAQQISKSGSWEYRFADRKLSRSKGYCEIFEFEQDSLEESGFLDRAKIHPQDVGQLEILVKQIQKTGGKFTYDFRFCGNHGVIKHIRSRVESVMDENNEVIEIYGYVQDITENVESERLIKNSLREKETLLKEIHHRVKNNLQVITSLLALQSSFIDDDKSRALFRYSQYRINSMAMIHEMLYQSVNLSKINYKKYIFDLSHSLLNSFKGTNSNIEISIDSEDIFFNVDTAIPLGLLINEVLTNSFKYGLTGDEGTIAISLKQLKYPNFILEIGDNGVGFHEEIDFRDTRTLGLKLIHRLSLQLRGNIEKINNKKGTNYILSFQEIEQTS